MLTVSDWGFVLLCFVISEVIMWLVGVELEIKEKLLLPCCTTIAIILLMIAGKMMMGG